MRGRYGTISSDTVEPTLVFGPVAIHIKCDYICVVCVYIYVSVCTYVYASLHDSMFVCVVCIITGVSKWTRAFHVRVWCVGVCVGVACACT